MQKNPFFCSEGRPFSLPEKGFCEKCLLFHGKTANCQTNLCALFKKKIVEIHEEV